MKRPFEETWAVQRYVVELGETGRHIGEFVDDLDLGADDEDPSRDRARLAAQAPAMARLLLSLGAMDVYDTDVRGRPVHMDRYQCSWCEGEGESVDTVPHLHDCRLVSTLRAAGVLE